MSQDGISSVADLRIVIDANTEKFANGLQASREALAKFAGDGDETLGRFDKTFGKLGDLVGQMPARFDMLVARLNPMIAGITTAYQFAKGAADKMGLGAEVEDLDNAFNELWASIGIKGPESLDAVGRSADDAKLKLAAIEEQGKGSAEGVKAQTVTQISWLTDYVKTVSASIKMLREDFANMSNDELVRSMKALEGQIKEVEATGTVTFQNMEAFGSSFGETVKAAGANVDDLKEKLGKLKDELTRRANDETPADLTKYIQGLERANEELKIRNDTLGMSKSKAAEYLAIELGKLEAQRQGKKIADETLESLEAAGDRRREEAEREEIFNEKKRQAAEAEAAHKRWLAEQEREQARQHKGIENIDLAMQNEIEQMLLKIDAQQRGTQATAAEVFEQKMLTAARRQNIDLTPDDIAGIQAQAQEYQRLVEIQKTVADRMELIRQTNQAISSSILNEFSSWTRGAEFNVKRMVSNILAELAKLAMQKSLLQLLGGGSSGGGGLLGGLLGGILGGGSSSSGGGGGYLDGYTNTLPFGGPRESGGRVDAGTAYLVGEKRPELFVPDVSGYIVPDAAKALGGRGAQITLNIDARGATPDAVAALEARIPAIALDAFQDFEARAR